MIQLFDLDGLRRDGKFADFMLVSWGMIDSVINWAVVYEFGWPTDLQKDHYLTRGISFERKLQFLQKRKVLGPSEVKILRDFSTERNDLFHGIEEFMRLRLVESSASNKLMDKGQKAIQICYKLADILFDKATSQFQLKFELEDGPKVDSEKNFPQNPKT
jgi:hypothetical protein